MNQKHLQDMYQKVLRNMEEQRAEFFQFQGQVSSRSHSDGLLSLQKQFEQHRQEFDSRLQAVGANALLPQMQQHFETTLLQQLSTHRQELDSRLQAVGPDALLPQLEQHLEKTLLQQLSTQLSSQLHQILQQQLELHVQPQLQQQLEQQVQQHLKAHYSAGFQELRDMCETEVRGGKELASQLRQRLREQDGIIAEGQEALRQEAAKREQHLAELQDAAQRLAQTAMERAQASTEAHAHVFSTSSSLANRLAVVEGELQSAQRQEKERQQKRIARLEEDLAKSPMLSPRDKAGPNAFDQPNLLRALDELRVQIFAELGDARKLAQHLSTRISRCEAGVAELQQVTRSSNTLPAFLAQASPKHGASNSDSCPTTPDWPVAAWPGQGQAGEAASRSSKLCGLPAPDAGQTNGLGPASQETLRRPSDSPTPSSPKATSTVHSKGSAGHGSALLGSLPEGPKLSHGALQDSPGKSPQGSTRFGVLPPPKVTPSTPLPLQTTESKGFSHQIACKCCRPISGS